ncbi:membrane protein [Virgibacillus pantothenticus]|uniref:Flagellar motor protein MotB n=1 Tax=Virgibacillus pantothenticus TaxID=1473 RepID=A0A0L0QMN9_VIRPA|nr:MULTISPECIES: OmpA family protein [Virgibacillus]API93599.1 flagellar motor protein MotB [Virgibacillus sp. 6R]KNE19890.1 flagellar motor protein MotB [Virgibacillus pantothenticus]MBS7430009.1 OmpA family protein [Virgibacillus sp. 19R1-5]MBU8564893.1 OmpA family protein [Virgibacillus pantothenticus]MBU8599201.1 OmpA family protein [Virgibacillus pantothenticus]
MNTKYQRLFRQNQDEGHFWPSFTDLLTTILLCFILIFVAMMIIKSLQIEEMKKTLDQIMGVRAKLVQDLKEEFSGSNLGVEVDEKTGAIIFSTEILFAYDNHELKSDSYTFLDEFVPKYLDILLRDGYEKYIAEIIIEGHTDRDGSYLYNLQLAQNRAYSVASYILSDDFPYKNIQQHLADKLTVNSKSFSDVRTDENGNYSAKDSRRVEFKFRLKDEEILDKTREILGR